MNTFPYIILLEGKLLLIELTERPQTKSWMSAGECGCFVNTSCACMDWANARCAAIEKAVEVENSEVVTNVFQLEMSNKRVLVEGEEVRWMGTWEKRQTEILCPDNIEGCEVLHLKTVARLIAPEPDKGILLDCPANKKCHSRECWLHGCKEQKGSVTQLKKESVPSEDLIVAFAKWYSGMDEVKVRTAYERWLREKESLNG